MATKYDGWTIGETRAILKMIGGVEAARQVLRGERRLRVNKTLNKKPAIEPLVGTVIKTIDLKPSEVKSVREAIKLGGYTGHHHGDIAKEFKSEEVGLAEAVKVDLVKFNRTSHFHEILTWAKKNGEKKPILPKHLFEIGIQHPEEQLKARIFALGPVNSRTSWPVLYLEGHSYSNSNWRDLNRCGINECSNPYLLFGFLS